MVPAARFGDSGRVQDCVTTSYQAPVKSEYAATAGFAAPGDILLSLVWKGGSSSCPAKRGRGPCQRVRPEVGAPHRARAMGTPGRPDDRLRMVEGALQKGLLQRCTPPPPPFARFASFGRSPSPAALRSAGADKRNRSRDAMRARGMPYNRMIPKSGYRFSDQIMRKRRSITPLSTIASRLNRRWDRFLARSCSASVARMERSVIRGRSISLNAAPGFRCASSRLQINKEAERRQAHVFRWSAPQTSLRSLRKPSASGAARAERGALA
jgi:hypothetical protein